MVTPRCLFQGEQIPRGLLLLLVLVLALFLPPFCHTNKPGEINGHFILLVLIIVSEKEEGFTSWAENGCVVVWGCHGNEPTEGRWKT